MGWARAPGKVILVGEHFVVHGTPAIAVPLMNRGVQVTATREAGAWAMSADIAAYVRRLLPLLGESPEQLTMTVASDLPVGAGLGGSAALAVALVRALDSAAALSDDEVRLQAHQLERVAHGTPSGIDDAVAAFACPVYYVKGQEPVAMADVVPPGSASAGAQGDASAPGARLWVGVTPERTSTKEAVARVGQLAVDRSDWFQGLLKEASGIATEAASALRQGNWVALGQMMTRSHTLLRSIQVSTDALDRLVDSAMAAGAFGAKLTGGGLGGAAIAIAPEGVDLTAAWQEAGATEVIAP